MSITYEMTVDINVLRHLGINLYSNIAAVLTEAIANSWDADSENVDISFDFDANFIEITDDGVGMSIDDMNNKYLRVGYRRREEDEEFGKKTAKGRQVMGRKGLGKLSLFSIAEVIEIQSSKGGQSHGLRMSWDGIREAVDNNERYYRPEPLPDKDVSVVNGTKITLKKIRRKQLGRGAQALRKRLARRFSIIGEKFDFQIKIDGHPITTSDREDLQTIQFLWTIGDFKVEKSSIPEVVAQEKFSGRIDDWRETWNISGWLGTARYPKELDNIDAGNLNGVVVFARGRLFHEGNYKDSAAEYTGGSLIFGLDKLRTFVLFWRQYGVK